MVDYKNYKFYDNETGEIFFVQAENLQKAVEIANEYFEAPQFTREIYDDEEAEVLGYDTY